MAADSICCAFSVIIRNKRLSQDLIVTIYTIQHFAQCDDNFFDTPN